MTAAPSALSDQAYTDLVATPPAQRLLAVVRCERTERLARGSRSERALLHTVVIAAGPAGGGPRGLPALELGSPVVLTRYAQGPDPLTQGATYLVAAAREEYAPAYTLLGAVPVGEGAVAAVLGAAAEELSRRERKAGGAPARLGSPAEQKAPVLRATVAVERGALVVRYVIENPGPELIVVGDRAYDLTRRSFDEDAAVIEMDAAAGRLLLRRDGEAVTAAQTSWVQRVPSGGRGQGRIALPLVAPPRGAGGAQGPRAPVQVRKIVLQLGWAPVSVVEVGTREPQARVLHAGCELEAIGGQEAARLRPMTVELVLDPPVTLR